MDRVTIHSGSLEIPIRSFSFSGGDMSICSISTKVESIDPINFNVGDWLDYNANGGGVERFSLRTLPSAAKKNEAGRFQYDLTFYPSQYDLVDALMFDIVTDGNRPEIFTPEHSVICDIHQLIDRINASLNKSISEGIIEPGWAIEVAEGVKSDNKLITFSADDNVWNACVKGYEEFDIRFEVVDKTIKFGFGRLELPFTFQVGKGKGMYELIASPDTSRAICTRAYVFGGERNIRPEYKWVNTQKPLVRNLMLPNNADGSLREYVDSDNGIIKYGIKPLRVKLEEIYPSIEDVVAGDIFDDVKLLELGYNTNDRLDEIIAVSDVVREDQPDFYIWIRDIGFDLKDYLSPEVATVAMKDGGCGGVEFQVVKQRGVTKITDSDPYYSLGARYKLRMKRNQDDQFILPNFDTKIRPGDKFVFLHIYFPPIYETFAENRLLIKAQDWLSQNDHQVFNYSLGLETGFMLHNPQTAKQLREGAVISIKDDELGVETKKTLQNISITYYDNDYPKYSTTISDVPIATRLSKAISDLKKEDIIINAKWRDEVTSTKRNVILIDELRSNIFDPDGNISDPFVQAMMIQVGANSQNYELSKTKYGISGITNILVNNDNVIIDEGEDLAHYYYVRANDGGYVWHINSGKTLPMPENKPYFLAIRIEKEGAGAEWVISDVPYLAEQSDDLSHWYVNYGIVSSYTDDSKRVITETRGNIYAYGDQLVAGRIQSINGLSWFDLTTGEFALTNNDGNGLIYKDGELTITAIEDIKQTISDLDYLKEALPNGSTEVYGGLVLSDFMGVKDAANKVVAGLSGKVPNGLPDYPMIFAGAADASKGNDASTPIRFYKDGRSFLKNAYVSGVVEATGGRIGGFAIDGDMLDNRGRESAFISLSNSDGSAQVAIGVQRESSAVGYFSNKSSSPQSYQCAIFAEALPDKPALQIGSGYISNTAFMVHENPPSWIANTDATILICSQAGDYTLPPPNSTQRGKVLIFRKVTTTGVRVYGKIWTDTEVPYVGLTNHCLIFFINNGNYWYYNGFGF